MNKHIYSILHNKCPNCLEGDYFITNNAFNLKDFEKMLNGFPAEKIGIVTSGEVKIDGDYWGDIEIWKEKYDTALENYLSKEEAGAALSSL